MTPQPLLFISIAGIRLALACSDPVVAGELAAYYQPFSAFGPPHLTAQIEVRPAAVGEPPADLGRCGRFEGGALVFSGPACEGRIDLAQNQAELALASAHPAVAIEYFVRSAYALLLFAAGGLLFHAAGIVRGSRAYLFFGHSGSGKTTVARLSRDGLVLNDDLVALLPSAGGWVAHATPFWNPTQVRPTLSQAPVAGLYRLVQAQKVRSETAGTAQALAEVLASVPVVAADPGRGPELLHRALELLGQVPVYYLHFLPDDTFWQVVAA